MRYFAVTLLYLGTGSAFAGGVVNGVRFFTAVPTLDEVGLAALIGIVGAVGGWVAGRTRKKKK
jgi:IPTL-CTERM motif